MCPLEPKDNASQVYGCPEDMPSNWPLRRSKNQSLKIITGSKTEPGSYLMQSIRRLVFIDIRFIDHRQLCVNLFSKLLAIKEFFGGFH
jgi:hypothetical protein